MDQNGLPDYVEKSASEAIVAASTFIDDVRALAYSLPEGQRNLVHPVRQVRSPLQATLLLLTDGPHALCPHHAGHHASLRSNLLRRITHWSRQARAGFWRTLPVSHV
jgi:hypothetical protein